MGIFGQFLEIGFRHILEGYDHLLFLTALVIVTRGWRPLLKVISAFTIAHSTTLVLSALRILSLPSAVTESLIALSIAYVGIENVILMKRREGSTGMPVTNRDSKRWIIAGAFGLIHGAGFSSHLTDLLTSMIGMGNIWSPLMGFNLGIECGQLVVIIVLFPLLWLLRRRRLDSLMVPEVSRVIAAIGGVLFVSRAFGGF